MGKGTVNFVIAANLHDSITRLFAEYSNHLVAKGFKIIVSYPIFNHWDFHLWEIQRKIEKDDNKFIIILRYLRYLIRPIIGAILKSFFLKKHREWLGKIYYRLDNSVELNRFFLTPNIGNMPDADYIIVMQEYLIPHLLYLPESKGKIIGSIHLDYADGQRDDSEVMMCWWSLIASMDRKLNVPLWVTSKKTKISCDMMGIKVNKIIYNGIDIEKFTDGKRRGELEKLRIMLYCHPKPQKGYSFGATVIKRLRKELFDKNVIFCSLGTISREDKALFDINLGYLSGNDYIRAYQDTDIFVYPSQYDGFPAPPLDAMACGCALVTTRVQGVEEYGAHMQNCMLAEPNDEETMVNNVITIVYDVTLRDKIREDGLLTVKRFSWEKSTDGLIEFMED